MLQEERNKKIRQREQQLRTQAVLRGDNPDEVMLRKKREKEESKKRSEFEEKRREKHLEIVTKLLEEEKMKKRSEKMAEVAHWQGRWPPEVAQQSVTKQREGEQKTKLRGLKKSKQMKNDEGENPVISSNNEAVPGMDREVVESADESNDGRGEGERGERDDDDSLAQPEIKGLWSFQTETETQQVTQEEEREEVAVVADEEGGRTRRRRKERSKLEQKMLTGVVDNLRQSIVKTQVAAGREFKVSEGKSSF